MVSARQLEAPAVVPTVGVTLEEKSAACEDGGGFEKTVWRVRVNDGWFRLDQLLQRRSVGWVRAELDDEDDPYGEAARGWQDLLPQVWWRRSVCVHAPVGTRFQRRLSKPNRERARDNPQMRGVPYDNFDREYELVREGALVPVDVIERQHGRGTHAGPGRDAPPSAEEVARNLGRVMAVLDSSGRRPR